VIPALDNHANKDKGHRQRLALQFANHYDHFLVNLTDPIDTPDLMLFRGKPQPFPVVLKGSVGTAFTQQPTLAFTYQKGTLDAQGDWGPTTQETTVPGDQLQGLTWTQDPQNPKEWTFRVVWNQQLNRTQVLPQKEAYGVWAYATSQGITRRPVPDDARFFQVLTMGWPHDVLLSGYTRDNRPGELYTHATSNNGRVIAARTVGGGPHLAYDLKWPWNQNPPDRNILAPEVGKVVVGDPFSPAPFNGKAMNDDLIDEIVNKAIELAGPNWQNTLEVDAPPGAMTGFHNDMILGPNRYVYHAEYNRDKKVNISVVDAAASMPYYQGTVRTKYCHLATPLMVPPDNGDILDLWDRVAQIGAWRWDDDSLIFARGYWYCDSALLQLRLRQPPYTVLWSWPNVRTTWPSTSAVINPDPREPTWTGDHLHFEVHIAEEAAPGIPNKGQQDPGNWLRLRYPARY